VGVGDPVGSAEPQALLHERRSKAALLRKKDNWREENVMNQSAWRWTRAVALAASFGAVGASFNAYAFQVHRSRDLDIHWDNTLSYNLGVRVQGINDKIGDNPSFNESNYKFSQAGDIVTNRISILSEADLVWKERLGFRISGSAWNDFAYDDDVEYNPGEVAPGVPYSAVGTRSDGEYGHYTKRFYVRGAQLLDAFVFANFTMAEQPASIRAGRLTQYWGNALIFGAQGINYSQNASDQIKASSAPGTQAKELAIPRAQVLLQAQVTRSFAIAAQYFFEYQPNRLPEGGTYLGITDFLFRGADQAFGGSLIRDDDNTPDELNDNFGLRAAWTPAWLRGTLAGYYRHFDETQPWTPLFAADDGQTTFHQSYATGVDMFALSLDKQIGVYSSGFELSYRRDTALNSATGPLPSDLSGSEGARGDTLNAVANVVIGLTPTSWYQTGTALAEIAYTRKLSVGSNEDLYNGTDYAGCPTGDKWDGCSTDDAIQLALQVDPQWLQVVPGVDLDMPIFAAYGLYGNTANLGGSVSQGAIVYTIGVHAFYRQKYNVTLQYNGYHARTNGVTNFSGGSVPLGTEGYPTYYGSGNGAYMYNDKGWLSLTISTIF